MVFISISLIWKLIKKSSGILKFNLIKLLISLFSGDAFTFLIFFSLGIIIFSFFGSNNSLGIANKFGYDLNISKLLGLFKFCVNNPDKKILSGIKFRSGK